MHDRYTEAPAHAGASAPHLLSDAPLPFGELVDLGLRDYHEAACSKSTMVWLQSGAMTNHDGGSVSFRVMEEIPGGHNVIVRFRP